jgi:hypothetical protein
MKLRKNSRYAEELGRVSIGDTRLERLDVFEEAQEEIRISWWPGGRMAPRPVDLPEKMLIELLAKGVNGNVLSSDFLSKLASEIEKR